MSFAQMAQWNNYHERTFPREGLSMYLVVSYDIHDDKRRNSIHKVLKNFGERIQFSVFECDMTKE